MTESPEIAQVRKEIINEINLFLPKATKSTKREIYDRFKEYIAQNKVHKDSYNVNKRETTIEFLIDGNQVSLEFLNTIASEVLKIDF